MSENSGKKSGCAPVIVLMVAFFCLTLGLLFGAGGLYAYLYYSDTGLERLRIAEIAEAAPVEEEEPEEEEIYALAHPILDSLNVHSSLDERSIRSHISERRDLLQKCYEEELARSPDTRGELDLQFTVHGESGDVVTAVVRNNRTDSESLAQCVTRSIQREWSFRAPDTAGVATVRFQTVFLPLRAN